MALQPDKQDTQIIEIADLHEMEEFASLLASLLLPGDVVLLYGDLGAGKTTLVQLLAKGLAISDDQYVSSPSFALLHEYSGKYSVNHMDLYRLSGEEDVEEAGLLDYFNNSSICIVEWPDRLESNIPDEFLKITITGREERRTLLLEGVGEKWGSRLEQLSL